MDFLYMKAKTQKLYFYLFMFFKEKFMTSVDFVKDIHQGDSLVTCDNEAFFLLGPWPT